MSAVAPRRWLPIVRTAALTSSNGTSLASSYHDVKSAHFSTESQTTTLTAAASSLVHHQALYVICFWLSAPRAAATPANRVACDRVPQRSTRPLPPSWRGCPGRGLGSFACPRASTRSPDR